MTEPLLTIITVSSKPIANRVLSPTCIFYNHICNYKDTRDIVRQKLQAVAEIETPYYLFLNEGDDTPINTPIPQHDKAVMLGDMYQRAGSTLTNVKGYEFSNGKHLNAPLLLTRAICRKDYTLELASQLTDFNVWFEFLYTYALAYVYGAQYDSRYVCSVSPEKLSSVNLNYLSLEKPTRLWLARNMPRVKKNLVG